MTRPHARRLGPGKETQSQEIAATTSGPILLRATVKADEHTVTICGPHVRETLRRARMRPIHIVSAAKRGWTLDRRRLDDVLVALERSGYAVVLEDSVPPGPASQSPSPAVEQSRELGLW